MPPLHVGVGLFLLEGIRVVKHGEVKSTCGICFNNCGVLIRMENGRAVGIKADPDSPVNKGVLCKKGLASLEYLCSPHRLKYPLKRTGEKGEGKWTPISWDDALSEVADAMIRAKRKYGVETVAFIDGSAKGLQEAVLRRFVNAFGSPNMISTDHICFVPRKAAAVMTGGFYPLPDYEYPPACILMWGANLAETRICEYQRLSRALQKGSKLVVIDPRRTKLARRADLWLPLRPGSDLALALGILNVIIYENLYDADFVANWTMGFDALKAHIGDYPPEKVSEKTWLPADTIRQVARMYASNRPAIIQLGNAVDQNVNSFQTARAVSMIRAITGNLGRPGGELEKSSLDGLNYFAPEITLEDQIAPDTWQKRVGAEHELLFEGAYALPQSLTKTILEEKPYPIRVVYIQACNPLLTHSNAERTFHALKKLPLLVVADMFMTPTAALADIVFPVSCYLEFDSIVAPPYYPAAQVQQKVARVGECRSDFEIINCLAKKTGLQEYFWENDRQFLNAILAPVGLTFEEFRERGVISREKQYRLFEKGGFPTPSGKVELYSHRLKERGFDPLPVYRELPETHFSNPELAKTYPLVLTSWKAGIYRHSGGRQIPGLRRQSPEPTVCLHPQTAAQLGIHDGDWVHIETRRGRIRQKAKLTTDLDPRVVGVDYGWWYPEKGPSALFGWAEANVNVLTDDEPPFSREMGSSNLRGLLCKVSKE
jgi:anaerobic selenocysteine-containing dehydrogenase